MIASPLPQMPMQKAAAQASGAPAGLPQMLPPPMPPAGSAPSGTPPPPISPGAALPPGLMPAPAAPATPPYEVRLQPDGSSIYVLAGPSGDVVLGVNPAPKLPKAFQGQPPA